MHAQHKGSNFPVRRTRVLGGAGDEEAFETKASPPAVAGPLVSFTGPGPYEQETHSGGAVQSGPRPYGRAAEPIPKRPYPVAPTPGRQESVVLDLLSGAETLSDSLALLAAASVRAVVGTTGLLIESAVVVHQAKRSPAIAGTSPEAVRLLEWEQEAQEGPASEVLDGEQSMSVLQRGGDFRWPRYCRQLQLAALGSALSLRLPVDHDLPGSHSTDFPNRPASAALVFFAQDPKAFPLQVISAARSFTGLAARSLQIALDLHAAKSAALDLRSALDSRTSINIACGVIMAQNRCSYLEAFSILAKASSHRNIKVRRIAEDILERLPEGAPRSHFGH